jgi:integrase
MGKPKTPKPKKPYKDFPLFPHAAGVWAKKIKGRLHYFGSWSDPDGSLAKYRLQVDDLQAGRIPREAAGADGCTLTDLANEFLTEKKSRLDEGTLSPHMFSDYQKVCRILIKHFGGSRLVDDIRPEDFRKLRASFAHGPRGKRGVVAIANLVRMSRVIFKFASDNELIDRPLNFGTAFKLPSKSELRRARQGRARREFSAAEIRSLIEAASVPVKAMVLLAINAAFGQTDLARLPLSAVDLKGGWVTFPRPKTGIDRRAKLWPQTVAAIEAAIVERPEPKDPKDADLVFITQRGQAWVRSREQRIDGKLKLTFADAIGQEFVKLLAKVGITGDNKNFYALRHTFLTVADELRDKPSLDLVMGHAATGIDAHYRERISDARLEAIAEHVKKWLFAKAKKR